MQALWLENRQLTLRQDAPIPKPTDQEALVKVRLAGICATDLEMVRGYYPFTGILGHEFVGEVIEAPGNEEWIGRRIVGDINISCNQCDTCRSGNPTHCEQRSTLGIRGHNGAFAEYLTLPVRNLHKVPDNVADDAAVFTEPLAAALEIQQQIHIRPTDRVLLIGAGRLGQLIAQTLALTTCDFQVAARHDRQRELLTKRNIQTISEDSVDESQWDLVVEATGSVGGFTLARRAVRPRGVIVLKSTYKGNVQVNLSSLVVDEIMLIGSRCGPFPPVLNLLKTKQVDPTALIDDILLLSDGVIAMERAAQAGTLKILITPSIV